MSMTYCATCDEYHSKDDEVCPRCERIAPDISIDDVEIGLTLRDVPLMIGGLTVTYFDDLEVVARVDANNRVGGVVVKAYKADREIEIDATGTAYVQTPSGQWDRARLGDPWRGLAAAVFEAAQIEIDSGRHACELDVARAERGFARRDEAADIKRRLHAI